MRALFSVIASILTLFGLVALPVSASAQNASGPFGVSEKTLVVDSWVEEWDPATQRWVKVEGAIATPDLPVVTQRDADFWVNTPPTASPSLRPLYHSAARFAVPLGGRPTITTQRHYGPFQVIDRQRAAIVGSTTRMSPAYFDAMLRDYPDIKLIEFVEAPGTQDDIANLAIGRKIRANGIATHVPSNGSVRSGAVELFLAGVTRTMDEGAEFAVHSWLDNFGREPDDYAPNAPENRFYLDYYREMGMSERRAQNFYAMTNSVPHHSAKWLDADDMRPWLAPERRAPRYERSAPRPAIMLAKAEPVIAAPIVVAPVLAYADMSQVSLETLEQPVPVFSYPQIAVLDVLAERYPS